MKVGQSGGNPELANARKTGKQAQASELKRTEKDAASGVEGSGKKPVNLDVKSEISAKSKEFGKAKEVATSAPEIREDKVAELKKRIAEKSYQVDSNAIADRLVDDHLRLISRED
ncbi:MAG: flagellar biosynthesis anti-sigma factor FlgM [Bdellovibrionia bacterium]